MTRSALTQSVSDVLRQGLELLAIADAKTFQTVAPAPHSASIGQHYRHVLDHFICLADGILSGTIDYDSRSRNRRLETDRDAARETTDQLIDSLYRLTDSQLKTRFKVLYSVGYTNDEPLLIETVLAREIAFCVSHTIHHFAIIKLLCSEFGIALPEEFGVAPSTLKYRAERMSA